MGQKNLKNVEHPMEIYALVGVGLASPSALSKFNTKRIGIAVVITSLVIVGLNIDFGAREAESKEDINSLSIAVLPFDNMSTDAENEFFADGITEDILTQISKIKSLQVISRTSIMQYKNTTKSLSEIGKELRVATILEGSVRRAGNRVRITAQLIDAETDKHLWADTYDREMDDIFAIQSDVALMIAAALEARLSSEEKNSINKKPTENIEAYDFYLKGIVLYDEFDQNLLRIREPLDDAIASYEKAVEIDSNFVIAYARLAKAHLAMYWFNSGWDRTDERLAQAEKALDKASEIDPEHPEVQLAMGFYYYWGYRNYDDALKYLIPALEKQPNNSDVSAVIGYVYRRNGNWTGAIESLQRAVDLDPRSSTKTRDLVETYVLNRMWKEAERYTDRLLLLKPESVHGYIWKMRLLYLSRGDLEESRMVLNDAMKNIDPNKLILEQGLLYRLERNFKEALNIFDSDTAKWYGEKAFLHLKLGHVDKAYSYYDSIRVEVEDEIRKDPKNAGALSKLGIAYAGLGKNVEAIEKGMEGIELMSLSKDALRGQIRIGTLAEIYTMVGEAEKAIGQLELLLSIPGYTTKQSLRIDPRWDSLREHPRFIKLMAN